MKGVIPAAGQGTRLFPQTHTKPKPMVRLAGKPILGHILDSVIESPIDEVVIVVGVMQDIVIDYVTSEYDNKIDVSFVEQEQAEGLGHAIFQSRSQVEDDGVVIMLGDMLFERGYSQFLSAHEALDDVDGSIGVKTVDEPSNYGIVSLEDRRIVRLEEKPDQPKSDIAISGIYVIENSQHLFESIEYLIENDARGSGDEYQLTDALQRMIDEGATFGTFEVNEWYDCGRPETLLEANRVLLESQSLSSQRAEIYDSSSLVIPPSDIGHDVTLKNSIVGPHVSIDDGATVEESHLTNSIVGRGATLHQVNLTSSLVGDEATVTGSPNELNVGDSSDIQL